MQMANTMKIERRAAIQTLLRGGLALGLLPGFAESAWSAVAAASGAGGAAGAGAGGDGPSAHALDSGQGRMIARIADTILPSSDTPGARDVGVPAWIDLVLARYFSDTRRAAFLSGLDAIDKLAQAQSGAHLAALSGADLATLIGTLDAACGSKDLTPAQRGYVQLKELVMFGYFTSKSVQQDLLKVVIVPGRFDADVHITPAGTQ
jgi:glucoside 3-dehydrogenase (cytochrome c) hitch-hiker subunit